MFHQYMKACTSKQKWSSFFFGHVWKKLVWLLGLMFWYDNSFYSFYVYCCHVVFHHWMKFVFCKNKNKNKKHKELYNLYISWTNIQSYNVFKVVAKLHGRNYNKGIYIQPHNELANSTVQRKSCILQITMTNSKRWIFVNQETRTHTLLLWLINRHIREKDMWYFYLCYGIYISLSIDEENW